MWKLIRAIFVLLKWTISFDDPTKARTKLGWEPRVKFHELVRIMVDADLELAGLSIPGEGKRIVDEKFGNWHRWEDQVISMDQLTTG